MIRAIAFLLVSGVVASMAQPVEAQIWRRLQDRVQDRVEERVEEEVTREADRLVDRSADAVADGIAGAFTGGSDRPAVETVDFRTLQDMLPARSLGMARASHTGESAAAFGMAMSHANAVYGEGERRIDITITDMGSLQGLAMMGNAWLLGGVEHESDDGFMHSLEYKGHPAMQASSTDENRSSMTVIVGERFAVAIEGHGYAVVDVERAMDDIPLQSLYALRHHGMTPEAIEELEQINAEYRESMAAWQAGMEEMETEVETVDFRELRALLPESVSGYTRTRAEGHRTSTMGFNLSAAEGVYEGTDGREIRVTLLDMAGAYNTLGLGMMWLAADFDRETESGYERTVEYKGFPAYEEVNQERNRAEMGFIAWERYLITVQGHGVGMNEVRSMADRINVNALPRQ